MLVDSKDIASAIEGPARGFAGIRPWPWQLCTRPAAQEPRRRDEGGIGDRHGEAIVPVAVARFLHVGAIPVGQSLGDHAAGCVHHSYRKTGGGIGFVECPTARVAAVYAVDPSDDGRPRRRNDPPQETLEVGQHADCGYQVNIIGRRLACRNPAM